MKTLYEIFNEFEIKGKNVNINEVDKTINIWDDQNDNTYPYELIKEDKSDYLSSIVVVNY